jgi:hypothetical protein
VTGAWGGGVTAACGGGNGGVTAACGGGVAACGGGLFTGGVEAVPDCGLLALPVAVPLPVVPPCRCTPGSA